MRVVIGYPPLESDKGLPLLGQNRQFQWAREPWRAYPVILASAATLLKNAGHKVFWLDGISEDWSYEKWHDELLHCHPDFLVIETKTPVIKKHWEIINQLKIGNCKLKIALVGDHVTALPKESKKNSRVDFVLRGGNYDYLLYRLLEGKAFGHNLDALPFIDRDLTRWELYAYKNSNYFQTPGTYTMFGRDCWWGRCSFCSWTTLFPRESYQVMSPKRALDEIGYLLNNYPIKEIMDDSGTFPVGSWLREFCLEMIRRGYHHKIKINANMRFNSGLNQDDYDLMSQAGFQFLLYGLESANQKTLDRLNKNLRVAQIEKTLKMAKKANLRPSVALMIGYPWETERDALRTVTFAHRLFNRGLIDTLQATVVVPYPGTPLFEECRKRGWIKTLDWDAYDMKGSVLKLPMDDRKLLAIVRQVFDGIWTPRFVIKKLKEGLTDWNRFKQYSYFAVKYFSKRLDFSGQAV